MLKTFHPIKTRARTGTATITETVRRITLELKFNRYGDFGDLSEIDAALSALLVRYENDPRPVEMVHPLTGETATISKGDGVAFAAIVRPTRQ